MLAGGVFASWGSYPSHSWISYTGGQSVRTGGHVGRASWRSGHGGKLGGGAGRDLRRHSHD